MIKNIPQQTYSDEQHRKAKTCTVSRDGERYLIWNPEKSSTHYVSHKQCDCIGFRRRGSCYHVLALSLWVKRNKGFTYSQAIEELFG